MFKVFQDVLDTAVYDINFNEENHTYIDAGGNEYMPSTTYISRYYDKFDAEKISYYVAKRENRLQEDVLTEWKNKGNKAAKDGTKVHKYAEDYYYGNIYQPRSKKEEAVVQFFDIYFDNEYLIPLAAEQILVDRDRKIAGTADLLIFDSRTNSIIIGDYKTNENLLKYHGYLKSPFEHLYNNNLNKYTLQLNLYRQMIELTDLPVSKMILIWLTNSGVMTIEVPPLKYV